MSYLKKTTRPDTVFWVGNEQGEPLKRGAQHVYVREASAKGILTQWHKAMERYAKYANKEAQPPTVPNHIYVGTVTWERLEET